MKELKVVMRSLKDENSTLVRIYSDSFNIAAMYPMDDMFGIYNLPYKAHINFPKFNQIYKLILNEETPDVDTAFGNSVVSGTYSSSYNGDSSTYFVEKVIFNENTMPFFDNYVSISLPSSDVLLMCEWSSESILHNDKKELTGYIFLEVIRNQNIYRDFEEWLIILTNPLYYFLSELQRKDLKVKMAKDLSRIDIEILNKKRYNKSQGVLRIRKVQKNGYCVMHYIFK